MRELADVDRCEDVAGEDLAEINGFYNTNLDNSGIESIKAGDFEGLANLGLLKLSGNRISALPPGVFDALNSLRSLALDGNRISALPAGFFDEFTDELLYPALTGNEIQSLPEGIFDGLPNLNALWLDDNNLTSLPAGVFDEQSDLFAVWLDGNELTSLPAGVFDHNPALSKVYLDNNALAELPAGVFDSAPSLSIISLRGNNIATLPEEVFDGLSKLETLYLNDNGITTLPEEVFDGLSRLETLSLADNSVATLPDSVFAALAALWWLSLTRNGMTSLPEGIFDDLGNLRMLQLQGNGLAALPDGVFDNNRKLWYLSLSDNELAALPANFLPDRRRPSSRGFCLALSGNRLEELPDDFLHVESSHPIVVRLDDNPGAPFEFTMEAVLVSQGVDQDGMGTAQVRYQVIRGAPVRMEADLGVAGGTASASLVVVRSRAVYSDVITVTQSVEGEPDTLTLGNTLRVDMEECNHWNSAGEQETFEFSGVSFGAGSPLTLFEATSQQASATNSSAMGALSISGTAQVGETLTADTSGIADSDGLSGTTFSYQWVANDSTTDTNIQDATAATYTPSVTDVGRTIKVLVSFTDDAGNEETLASAATAAVASPRWLR